MPGIQEFKNLMEQMREAMRKKLPDIAATMSISAKAIAERKIKNAGFGRTYSTTQVPAFLFAGKELNAQGTKWLENHGVTSDGKQGEGKKKRRKKKSDPDPGSYDKTTNWGEFRGAQGLQNQFVDLSYSNKMWANIQPVRVEQKGDLYLAPLGGTNTEAVNKMNWNRDRYGDFIGKMIEEPERDALGNLVIREVEEVISQFL